MSAMGVNDASPNNASAPPHRAAAHHSHAREHGHTWPAWVTVGIVAVGTVISAIAFPFTSALMFWVGVAVIVLGVVVGYVWSRSDEAALPRYTETTPEATNVEGPTRSADGTNKPYRD